MASDTGRRYLYHGFVSDFAWKDGTCTKNFCQHNPVQYSIPIIPEHSSVVRHLHTNVTVTCVITEETPEAFNSEYLTRDMNHKHSEH